MEAGEVTDRDRRREECREICRPSLPGSPLVHVHRCTKYDTSRPDETRENPQLPGPGRLSLFPGAHCKRACFLQEKADAEGGLWILPSSRELEVRVGKLHRRGGHAFLFCRRLFLPPVGHRIRLPRPNIVPFHGLRFFIAADRSELRSCVRGALRTRSSSTSPPCPSLLPLVRERRPDWLNSPSLRHLRRCKMTLGVKLRGDLTCGPGGGLQGEARQSRDPSPARMFR